MRKPNFFIVGAPKCGTTSLSEYLREHRQIFVSNPKEPFYFCTDLPGLCKVENEAAYLGLFQSAGPEQAAVGEASAIYLSSPEAIDNIHAFNRDARIIAMLRNPIELLPSYHSQQLYSLNEDESDFARAWHLQQTRAVGKSIPRLCQDAGVLQYQRVGLLGQQVERLLSVFPREQVLLVLFDDFKASTLDVYQRVLKFLEVSDDGRQSFPRLNQNKAHRFRAAEALRRAVFRYPALHGAIRRGFEQLGVASALRSAIRTSQPRQPLEAQMVETLHSAFDSDIKLLATLIDRDLSHWTVSARAAA